MKRMLLLALLLSGCANYPEEGSAGTPSQGMALSNTGSTAAARFNNTANDTGNSTVMNATTNTTDSNSSTTTANGTTSTNSTSANATASNVAQIDLGGGNITQVQNSTAVAVAADATVANSTLDNFQGGQLTLSAGNSSTHGVTLNTPADPSIGTIAGNGTSTVTVQLDGTATPVSLQSFLQGVTMNSDTAASYGQVPLSVNLTTASGDSTGTATRTATITGTNPLNLTVGKNGVVSLQQALDTIAATANAQGSTIIIPSGNGFNTTASVASSPSISGLGVVTNEATNFFPTGSASAANGLATGSASNSGYFNLQISQPETGTPSGQSLAVYNTYGETGVFNSTDPYNAAVVSGF